MNYWHVLSAWDSILEAMKTLQNLTMRLLKEETLTKLFTEQDSVDAMFYSSNSGGGSSTKSNMEVKKKKAEQIVELKKKSQCNYCHEKGHWERECKKKKGDEKEDNTTVMLQKVESTLSAQDL
ncbi:unnamed protein product [Sphagnum balticum]